MLARVYEVKSWRRVSPLLAFGMLLLGLILPLSSGGLFAPGGVKAKVQLTQETPKLTQPLKPLGSLLNEDGTLNLKSGFSGSLDAGGWQMVSEPRQQPRFMPIESKETKGYSPSASGPLVPGDENWDDRFALPGIGGSNSHINAIAVSGTDIYVGGQFSRAGGVVASSIAKWDGSQWSALGSGVTGGVGLPDIRAIAVSGSNVYVGGNFDYAGGTLVGNVAKWNGSAWSALGSGLGRQTCCAAVIVTTIGVSGTDIYAGGTFTTASGVSANNIAKWNGSQWSALGGGVGGVVNAIATIGSDVYVGGGFTNVGDVNTSNIAKWNGSEWSALGSGIPGGQGGCQVCQVIAIAVRGSDVYVGGYFGAAGGVTAPNIAKWNGSEWSALGSGLGYYVLSLAVSGTDVYAGGTFTTAGGVSANQIARWNGSQWSPLSSGVNDRVTALASQGGALYVGGYFSGSSELGLNHIAKWNGSQWSPLGFSSGVNTYQLTIGAGGGNIYVGGSPGFTIAGRASVSNIAKWNGSEWSALGSGVDGAVYAIAVNGSDVYVGGAIYTAGGVIAPGIAKWNGTEWSALGSGVNGQVHAIAVGVNELYVGGIFNTAGGISANNIAKWNGTEWSTLGSGVNNGVNNYVNTIAVNGSDVYVGGPFTTAGGVTTGNIAKWHGSQWSALGSAMGGGYDESVLTIATSGSDLYVGGLFRFSTASGATANNIAKWDGSQWSALGSGTDYYIRAIAVSDSDVYVGGYFSTAGGVSANNIAKWNGSQWSALGSGVGGGTTGCYTCSASYVYALAVSGNDLYVDGDFTTAGDKPSYGFGIWHGVGSPTPTPTSVGPPVILLHGFNGLDKTDLNCNPGGSGNEVVHFTSEIGPRNTATRYWGKFPDWLRDAGYDVWVAQVTTGRDQGTDSLESNGKCLANQIGYVYTHVQSHQKAAVIAHSMGGLVSRAALKDQTAAREVSALYTIESPHAGLLAATIADWASPFSLLGGLVCLRQPGLCNMDGTQMVGFNREHRNKAGISYGFIGGDHSPKVSLSPSGPNDGLVTSLSALGLNWEGHFDPSGWASDSAPWQYLVDEVHGPVFGPGSPGNLGLNPSDHRAYGPTQPRPGQPNEHSYSYTCTAYLLHPDGPRPSVCAVFGTVQNGVGTNSYLTATTSPDLTSLLEPVAGHISPGQFYTHTLVLDAPGAAQFSLSWVTGTLAFTLTQPDGTVIDPLYVASHSDIVSYGYLTVNASLPPMASYYFTATNQVGAWTLNVGGTDLPADGTNYVSSTAIESTRTFTVTADKAQYDIGDTALISATLQSGGVGLPGANVAADITQPDGVTETLSLVDRGNGVYNANYVIPNKAGVLTASVRANGIDSGTQYTRHNDTIVTIAPQDARVTGPHSYQALNNNGDQLYEALAFTTTVTATTATTYTMYADLMAGSQVAAHASAYLHLITGTQTVTLLFDGNDIRTSRLNGPYTITHMSLVNVDLGITAQSLDNVLTTQAYNWQDFGGCYTLTTASNPPNGGTIAVSSAPNCSAGAAYSVDTSITLTATSNTGYSFINWTGDITGTTSVITTTLNSDKTAQANFVQVPVVVGHVTWQGRPTQPHTLQQLPITMTLKSGTSEANYPTRVTDMRGYFTVTVGAIPTGTYNYRVKNPKYLANSGTITLTGTLTTNLEMGLMRAGDANNDNVITILDFNILKNTFGRQIGDPGYDDRADFTGDQVVTVLDFNPLRGNFGVGGSPPIRPGPGG